MNRDLILATSWPHAVIITTGSLLLPIPAELARCSGVACCSTLYMAIANYRFSLSNFHFRSLSFWMLNYATHPRSCTSYAYWSGIFFSCVISPSSAQAPLRRAVHNSIAARRAYTPSWLASIAQSLGTATPGSLLVLHRVGEARTMH